MSKFRPQIKTYARVPAQSEDTPEISAVANRQQKDAEELRSLSGIDNARELATPVKPGVNWLLVANVIATLACLVLIAITGAELNAVNRTLKESKSYLDAAARAAREAESAAKSTESAIKILESRMAQQVSDPDNAKTPNRNQAVTKKQKRK